MMTTACSNTTRSPRRLRGHAILGALAGVAALAGAAALRTPLQQTQRYQSAFAINDEQTEQLNQSPFALILGEVRASMADVMWVKTERYLHRGMAFAPHLNADALARTGEAVAAPEPRRPAPGFNMQTAGPDKITVESQDAPGHAREAAGEGHAETTIIPIASADYRGFVGEIERRVQPWQDPRMPHSHTNGEELLPWYRLLTLSNPHNWRGYMIGAWWISEQKARDPGAMAEAVRFVEEGMRNNPEVFQLRLVRGRMMLAQNKPREAIADFQAAQDLALKIRTPDGKPRGQIWTESDEEDFIAALRYVPLLQARQLRDVDAARRSLARALQLVSNDGPLQELDRELNPGAPAR